MQRSAVYSRLIFIIRCNRIEIFLDVGIRKFQYFDENSTWNILLDYKSFTTFWVETIKCIFNGDWLVLEYVSSAILFTIHIHMHLSIIYTWQVIVVHTSIQYFVTKKYENVYHSQQRFIYFPINGHNLLFVEKTKLITKGSFSLKIINATKGLVSTNTV